MQMKLTLMGNRFRRNWQLTGSVHIRSILHDGSPGVHLFQQDTFPLG